MSIKLLQELDESDFSDLTPNEKLTLIALVTSAEKGGNFSWAGINLIRKRTNINLPTTIRKAIRGLISKNYLIKAKSVIKDKVRVGFNIKIPTKKMQSYHDFLGVEKEQNALKEESKLLHYGGSSLLYINSKERNSKNRNSKKLLSSTEKEQSKKLNTGDFMMDKDSEEVEVDIISRDFEKKKKFRQKEKKGFSNKNPNVGKSVNEIVNQQMKSKPIPKKINAPVLLDMWNLSNINQNPKFIPIKLSGKVAGNLKYILKQVEGQDVKQFIETLVGDWFGYQQVCKNQDVKSTSTWPSIPYLTQYLEPALLFYGKKSKIIPIKPQIQVKIAPNKGDYPKEIVGHTPVGKSASKLISGAVVLSEGDADKELKRYMEGIKKEKYDYLNNKGAINE